MFAALCDEYTYRYGQGTLTDEKLRDVLNDITKQHYTWSWRDHPSVCPMMSKLK